MALPEVITVVPPETGPEAEITVPGSKSITNRALVLAALARGITVLRGALWSEDTQVMVDCLQRLGFALRIEPDSHEPANRTITVQGRGGEVPKGGTLDQPLELFVGNAGTAARFLVPFLCLGEGVYQIDGVARMRERPQAALFQALRQLGYSVEAPRDKLPALVRGGGVRPGGRCQVSIEESSQFASGLLLCASTAGWQVEVIGANAEESPYVEMTRRLAEVLPASGGVFDIEPDASSGSYFIAADWLLNRLSNASKASRRRVAVAGWPESGWQIDADFGRFLPLPREVSRARDLGDSIMTAVVLAPWAEHPVRFTELSRLRVQECERVAALRAELNKCGARVAESGDMLTVEPSELHGARIETYNDHRMAMCFAILGLKVPGIAINNPACVKKTFPNFFQKLGTPPPGGLGVQFLDGLSGRVLGWDELVAH